MKTLDVQSVSGDAKVLMCFVTGDVTVRCVATLTG